MVLGGLVTAHAFCALELLETPIMQNQTVFDYRKNARAIPRVESVVGRTKLTDVGVGSTGLTIGQLTKSDASKRSIVVD